MGGGIKKPENYVDRNFIISNHSGKPPDLVAAELYGVVTVKDLANIFKYPKITQQALKNYVNANFDPDSQENTKWGKKDLDRSKKILTILTTEQGIAFEYMFLECLLNIRNEKTTRGGIEVLHHQTHMSMNTRGDVVTTFKTQEGIIYYIYTDVTVSKGQMKVKRKKYNKHANNQNMLQGLGKKIYAGILSLGIPEVDRKPLQETAQKRENNNFQETPFAYLELSQKERIHKAAQAYHTLCLSIASEIGILKPNIAEPTKMSLDKIWSQISYPGSQARLRYRKVL